MIATVSARPEFTFSLHVGFVYKRQTIPCVNGQQSETFLNSRSLSFFNQRFLTGRQYTILRGSTIILAQEQALVDQDTQLRNSQTSLKAMALKGKADEGSEQASSNQLAAN